MREPLVTVIIPVYNDAERLARCLDCLARQTYPGDRLQVVVVDNGSQQDIGAVVAAHFPRATLLREGRPGSYAARNRGLEAARGEVLAFTDADCLPDPGWIAAGVAALEARPALGLVAGLVEVFPRDPHRPTGPELYDMEFGMQQSAYLEKQHYGVTANLFTRAAVMREVGPFDAALRSNGDREWGARVWAAGYAQEFVRKAAVRHPARLTLRELARKARRIVGGRIDLGAFPMAPMRRLRRWIRLAAPPLDLRARTANVRRQHGRGAAIRFYWTVYAIRVVGLGEEIRLALGGASRR